MSYPHHDPCCRHGRRRAVYGSILVPQGPVTITGPTVVLNGPVVVPMAPVRRLVRRPVLPAPPAHRTPPLVPAPTPAPRTVQPGSSGHFRTADAAIVPNFLTPQERSALWAFTLARRSDFAATRIMKPGSDRSVIDYLQRKSRVITDLGRFRDLFVRRINQYLPWVFHRLRMKPFAVSQIETQLTATNDGEYFKTHNDNTHHDLRGRRLTFVYYFHQEPKTFSGGELRLYDSWISDGRPQAAQTFREIPPLQNQMVFFPSDLMHEVRLVTCPSRRLVDSRFTVNGWLHGRDGDCSTDGPYSHFPG